MRLNITVLLAVATLTGCAGGNRGTGLRGDTQWDSGGIADEESTRTGAGEYRWLQRLFASRCEAVQGGKEIKVGAESEFGMGTLVKLPGASCAFLIEPQSTRVSIELAGLDGPHTYTVIRERCGERPRPHSSGSILGPDAETAEIRDLRLAADTVYRVLIGREGAVPPLELVIPAESFSGCRK